MIQGWTAPTNFHIFWLFLVPFKFRVVACVLYLNRLQVFRDWSNFSLCLLKVPKERKRIFEKKKNSKTSLFFSSLYCHSKVSVTGNFSKLAMMYCTSSKCATFALYLHKHLKKWRSFFFFFFFLAFLFIKSLTRDRSWKLAKAIISVCRTSVLSTCLYGWMW